MPWAAIGSAAANFLGARYSAKKQAGLAREQMRWNARQAQISRDFQERMSNTSYQRAAKDLEAAGLNRILALGSGATTPGGAVAAPVDLAGTAKAYDQLGQQGSKAIEATLQNAQVASAKQAVKNAIKQGALIDAQTNLTNQQAGVQKNTETLTGAGADLVELAGDAAEHVGMPRQLGPLAIPLMASPVAMGAAGLVGARGALSIGRALNSARTAITNTAMFQRMYRNFTTRFGGPRFPQTSIRVQMRDRAVPENTRRKIDGTWYRKKGYNWIKDAHQGS